MDALDFIKSPKVCFLLSHIWCHLLHLCLPCNVSFPPVLPSLGRTLQLCNKVDGVTLVRSKSNKVSLQCARLSSLAVKSFGYAILFSNDSSPLPLHKY